MTGYACMKSLRDVKLLHFKVEGYQFLLTCVGDNLDTSEPILVMSTTKIVRCCQTRIVCGGSDPFEERRQFYLAKRIHLRSEIVA